MRAKLSLAVALVLTSCSKSEPAFDAAVFEQQLRQHRLGQGADHWIEMKNMTGEWEKTGLIFGYVDDYDECLKAIEGMKRVNYAREYRCTPAN